MTSGAAASRYARALFDVTLKEGADVEKVQRELDEFVTLFRSHEVLSQTLGNPAINVIDIAAVGAIAREAGIPFIVDNTAASPYLCQPLAHGADIDARDGRNRTALTIARQRGQKEVVHALLAAGALESA